MSLTNCEKYTIMPLHQLLIEGQLLIQLCLLLSYNVRHRVIFLHMGTRCFQNCMNNFKITRVILKPSLFEKHV
jgi:hypothetical protein